ncbi:MAG: YraN family protein [Vicinamibacterales bacterium]|nr:YraN family protein [Vicinamibacterales bacterium]
MALAALPRMTEARQAMGKFGEELACAALESRGYALIERRYRTRFGEIDIVAQDGETLVFVEVKARQDGSYGDPSEAVTLRKQQRLVAMATEYLHHHRREDAPCRFDVVSVLVGVGAPAVEVIPDAFRPGWV